VYDGGVLTESDFQSIRLQQEELLSWRLIPREEITEYVSVTLGRRILAALDVLGEGRGTVELENGLRVA